MATKEIPTGELFSRVYLERTAPVRDSPRFRTRLDGFFYQNLYDHRGQLSDEITTELGVSLNTTFGGGPDLTLFFATAEIRDILDTISLITRILQGRNYYGLCNRWIKFVQRTFDEESLGYRVDSKGGVHYVVDEEFEINRVSAIAALTLPKYAAVTKALESAFSALDGQPINAKAAVRDTFEALETLVKLLTDSNKNLDEKMVRKELGDLLRRLPEYSEPSGASTISKFIESLADWVNAAHPYRHGQKTEKLVAPSLTSAVLFLSTGAAYIRWLVAQLGDAEQ